MTQLEILKQILAEVKEIKKTVCSIVSTMSTDKSLKEMIDIFKIANEDKCEELGKMSKKHWRTLCCSCGTNGMDGNCKCFCHKWPSSFIK